MIVTSILTPSPGNLGDFWFNLADRTIFEYRYSSTTSLTTDWYQVIPGIFTSPNPPTTNSQGIPTRDLWVDPLDPNEVPYLFDRTGKVWIRVLPFSFQFPPLYPNLWDTWVDTRTQVTYMYNGASGWGIVGSVGVGPVTGTTASNLTGINPIQIYGNNVIPPGINGISPASSVTTPSLATHSPPRFVLHPPSNPIIFSITDMCSIYQDGNIAYLSGYVPDTAAKIFWNALANYYPPIVDQRELEDLRKKVAYAEAAGFKFPKQPVAFDPNDAWHAAMGVII